MLATSILFGALLALSAPQQPRDGDLVLNGIRRWSAGGAVSEASVVVVRDGRYQLAGSLEEALALAPAAHVVDAAEDWILYPGLVHADFPASVPAPPPSPYGEEATDPREAPIPAMEYGSHDPLRGWLCVADTLEWDPDKADDWRAAGFTTAHVLPKRGLVRGRSALLSLNGHPLGGALLERAGRMCYSLRGSGGYPSTPMAALAVLRQALLDRDRRSEGRGGRFAAPDLDPLENGVYLADSPREIENLLDLLRDFAGGGQGSVILGGGGAWKHADRLLEQDIAVLYLLDLAEAPKSDEELKRAEAGSRPWHQLPQALMDERRREHAEAVSGFRRLIEAGVRCALVPKGPPADWKKALAQLAEDGLSADQLYAAASLDALAALGLEVQADAADFVVSEGPFDFQEPKLAWVLAGGRAWEWDPDEEEPDTGAEEESATDPDMAGEWLVKLETPMGAFQFGIEVRPLDQMVFLFDPDDPGDREQAENIRFRAGGVVFSFTPPNPSVLMTLDAELSGDSGSGTLETPFGELEADIERIGGPKEDSEPAAADPGEAAPATDDPELGHPEWRVETWADRRPAHDFDGSLLLKGGTLYTLAGEEPFLGDLLILDGRIAAVGGQLAAPAGVTTLDAAGWHLMPGIIDAHSHLALDSINEGSVAISAECRIADMLHPEEVGIWRAAAGGTAVAQALHGSANPIGGQAAVWELDAFEPTIAGLLLPGAAQGIKFALGENVKRSNGSGWGDRFPGSRAGVQAVYRRAFSAAQDYARRRQDFERGELPGFRRDVRLEVLAEILANRIHIQCHGYRGDELLMFLRVCEEFGIQRPTFQHVLEGYKVASEMAEVGAMASTFADWWAYKLEVIDAIPWNPALMLRAGVTASINSDSDEMIRRLNTEAGKSLRYGRLGWQQAMALCSANSAVQLRLEDRLGRLAPGMDGTVSVFDAPPLSTYARCVLTLARGRALFERAADHDHRWRGYAESAAAFAQELKASRTEPAEPAAAEPAAAAPAPDDPAWEPWIRNGRGRSVLVRNARIHPVASPAFDGALLVRDGRVAWLGERWQGELPAGCAEVDAGGMQLYPGFLNAGDVTGLWEVGSLRASRDDAETGTDHPDLSLASAVHADSKHHRVTRMNGVTHVLAQPTQGRIRGQAALIQLDGSSSEELVTVPDLALCLAFPRARAPKDGKAPEEPATVKELDRWFESALEYGQRAERLAAAGVTPAERDRRLEALLPYARGEKPVLIEAEDLWTLMAARTWVRKRSLDPIYAGARDAWKAAGYFAADHARLILGPVHSLPQGDNDPFDAPYRNPGLLADAGCQVALRTANPEVTRNLPFQAATAATHGWNREAALRAITLGAAEVLGVDAFTGSLEVGKAANFFLAEGDPLDFPGVVRRMWIGGREVELSSHQTELRDRYAARIEEKR